MRFSLTIVVFLVCASACGTANTKQANTAANAGNAAIEKGTNPPLPKDGDYFGKGKVTKINNDLGSVELDHEEVPGLMPAMQMEFFVSDKALLTGLALGDKVDFTIYYKGGSETITKLTKLQ